mgnify:FL=1
MVKETHKLIQDTKTKEYSLVDEQEHAVKLGTTSLKLAKKRSLIFLQKRKNND